MEDDDSKIFPQRLMDCLSDPMNQDAICWLPHGKAFIIHNRKLFAEKVMPQYFSRKAKYSSFTRKLNRWYVFLLWQYIGRLPADLSVGSGVFQR